MHNAAKNDMVIEILWFATQMDYEAFKTELATKILTDSPEKVWRIGDLEEFNKNVSDKPVKRTIERWISTISWLETSRKASEQINEVSIVAFRVIFESLISQARKQRKATLFVQIHSFSNEIKSPNKGMYILVAEDGKGAKRWLLLKNCTTDAIASGLVCLSGNKPTVFFPSGSLVGNFTQIKSNKQNRNHNIELATVHFPQTQPPFNVRESENNRMTNPQSSKLSHLDRLEAESLYIIREVMAHAENPVMLYSVGKDSAVMLHLAQKAFYPSPPPFPLMHVDTRWKFQAMYEFRDAMAKAANMDLIVHINPEGIEKNINPFDHGSALHTDIMKTQGLKQALDKHGFDVAFGGARRDEEKSRAKERIFSFRNSSHRWDPKNQRPELWNLYNCRKAPGESVRVFPLSNWTELDIWQYIYRENIPIVPLYFAAERPVVDRNGMLIMVDDDRMQLLPGETIETKTVRFRTLGCYPLTGAVESTATDLSQIVLELLQSRTSERQGRAIDTDSSASMEKKKQEGYF